MSADPRSRAQRRRDIMIEGEVEVPEIDGLPRERGDRFVVRTGFDPRADRTVRSRRRPR
jgi:hypothetical protein